MSKNPSPLPADDDDDELHEAARINRRAAFLASLGPLPLDELASAALDECVATVASSLKAEPARGLVQCAALGCTYRSGHNRGHRHSTLGYISPIEFDNVRRA